MNQTDWIKLIVKIVSLIAAALGGGAVSSFLM